MGDGIHSQYQEEKNPFEREDWSQVRIRDVKFMIETSQGYSSVEDRAKFNFIPSIKIDERSEQKEKAFAFGKLLLLCLVWDLCSLYRCKKKKDPRTP